MHAGAEKECDERRCVLVDFHRGDGGVVDVAQEEVVHRSIPIPCELVPGDAIPPVCVETAVREVGDLGEEIEDTFPDHVPGLDFVS